MSKIKAVIFDIDGTLSEKNSWWELAEKLGATKEENISIYLDNKSGKLSDAEASRRVFEMWTRKGPVQKKVFEKILSEIPLRPEALEVVEYLKSKQIIICPITGSNEIYAEIIAKKIGADSFYANAKFYWNAHDQLVDFEYHVNQADIKLEQFNQFCARCNLQPTECAAVGDSYNDYELFRVTGKGIAVRTEFEDKELERLAWKTIDHLSQIKLLI